MIKLWMAGLALMAVLAGCAAPGVNGDVTALVPVNATDDLCPDGSLPVDCGDEAMMSTVPEVEEEDCGCGD